jgi:hypothetical protein
METGEGTCSKPSRTFYCTILSAHRWHLQSFHHGRITLLLLFSFLVLHKEAFGVVVEALVYSYERSVRVEVGDLNVPATIHVEVRLTAVDEYVVRQ